MDRYSLCALQYASTVIGGITDESLTLGSVIESEPVDGQIMPRLLSMTAQNPSGSFTTVDLKTALDAITSTDLGSFNGVATDAALLALYLQKFTAGGGPATGSVHRKLLINSALIHLANLSVNHQGNAALNYGIVVGYDGSNNPVIPSDTNALPTLTTGARWTLGPIEIGGVTLAGFKTLNIDFGVTPAAEGAESAIWPTVLSIVGLQPSITIGGIDPTWFKTSGGVALAGLAATHANSKIYLRKRAAGGTFVADITAEHISFTLAGMAVVENAVQTTEGPAGVTLNIPLHFDGTNLPLVIDTATAIS